MPRPKLTIEQFIERAKSVHGDKYSYELVDYKTNATKVKIICPIHGVFEQTPANHLSNHGCPECGKEDKGKAKASTAKSEFATKASIVHGDLYSYELVEYKTNKIKVSISCPSHGSFEQTPAHHLNGSGCPVCSLSEKGWTRSKFADKCEKNNESKGILYILECFNDNERFLKIGITSRSVKQRYCSKASMPYEYTTLHELEADPEVIYDLETLLHKKSKNYRYTPNLQFAGHATECFEANPTYLDKLNTYLDFNKLIN